ncbi:hypothetical protein AAG570_003979 [Ranatra chinensis]|uniref:CUB domain-containing protein n=1 Tax=Ranatra chinensis TaxID=642074 RepID=A0ABD0YKK8_9HEMI
MSLLNSISHLKPKSHRSIYVVNLYLLLIICLGVCLNPYECKIQHGEALGPCALGFGVCCVFTATCDEEIENNVTYFVNPDFPGLTQQSGECIIKIKKIASDISQIRLDFTHFNLGQPNRKTGVCEVDVFTLSDGNSQNVVLCGQNSGEHLYFDVDNMKDPLTITMNLTQENLFRIWEIKISQIEFNRRAPAGCRQYHQSRQGEIRTMNYAINGRHLANQDYNVCIRQEEGMCSVAYEPCDDNSFKIGPPIAADDPGSGDGPLTNSLAEFRECNDRIIMPCDSEDFIMPGGIMGMCNLLHCGNTFCSSGDRPCKIESSIKPFSIRVQFGPGTKDESPEDNLGMCLKFEQLPCT